MGISDSGRQAAGPTDMKWALIIWLYLNPYPGSGDDYTSVVDIPLPSEEAYLAELTAPGVVNRMADRIEGHKRWRIIAGCKENATATRIESIMEYLKLEREY